MGTRPGSFGGESDWFDRPAPQAERELALEAPEERLPWLESDDDGEDAAGFDTGRLVGLGLLLLVALVLVVGAVWFIANRSLDDAPAPDGSLIAAPATPYKERPSNPGGKTFAGTGDTSYAVGAGKKVEGKLAAATPAPSTALEPAAPAATPTAQPAPGPAASKDSALPRGTAVQVGAYSTRADAEAGWRRLSSQTDALSGVSHRIIAGRADIGTVYRLQAAGGSAAGARALCDRLESAGIACQVK
jgi:hypothetical protein